MILVGFFESRMILSNLVDFCNRCFGKYFIWNSAAKRKQTDLDILHIRIISR